MAYRTIRRLRGFDYAGIHRYFLTWCTHARERLFEDADVVESVVGQILRTASSEHFSILAYCVMPDHVHLIVEGGDERADLRRFVQHAKQATGYAYRRRTSRRLWQRRYYERVIRDDEGTRAYVRYLLGNPVRAGLARVPRDYPFVGSGVWTIDELLAHG